MASVSLQCPKASAVIRFTAVPRHLPTRIFTHLQIPASKGSSSRRFPILKAQVAIENSSVSALNTEPSNGKVSENEEPVLQSEVPESVITAFLAEGSDLVKLVDSRNITELQLKNGDCELTIRKKGALPQQAPPQIVMMQSPQQAMYQPQTQMPSASPPPAPAQAASAVPAPAKSSKSSYPPLKCPMAGMFYRSPAPGEPPYIKVGDKVKKGQVVCIIEAMKLMNEIEADASGTVVEVIAEDGKPVSVDIPLFVIEP